MFRLLLLTLAFTVVCGKHVHGHHKPLTYHDVRGTPYTVSSDERAILINGSRVLIQSGSIHYPRSTPDMWPDLLARTKAAGLNTVQIYIFWNYHEFVKGVYDFTTENRNVLQFIQNAADAGLWVNMRIGPYACAEWTYGGLPVWLRDEPGMVFRTDNVPWKYEMQQFMDYVVKITEPYLARHGGPIFLAQIENEYGNIEAAYGDAAKRYVAWAANLANSYDLNIPWIMCQQEDAPMSVLNTCNGFYCDNWLDNHFKTRKQPGMWTENWPGWFQDWGEPVPHRPVEDVSFAVARFIARGGTFHNYYMFHGGTTFGRHTGGPFILTSYDYDVALNEYGLPHEPKYSHSAVLHHRLRQYSTTILSQAAPTYASLGWNLESHTYGTIGQQGSILFLSNINTLGTASTVVINNITFTLPLWSVTLVDGATLTSIYCTATIAESIQQLGYHYEKRVATRHTHHHVYATSIQTWNEPKGTWDTPVVNKKPLEQLSVTKDKSDFLWYQTTVELTQDQVNSGSVTLTVTNIQDYFEIFFNSISMGTGRSIILPTSYAVNVSSYTPGSYSLAIACQTIGLVNYGVFLEQYTRGILGSVSWGQQDITSSTWNHVVGLKGEKLQIWTHDGSRNVPWKTYTAPSTDFQWYQLNVASVSQAHAHDGADPKVWALDMGSMGKGMVWVNGHMLGRYWLITATGSCAPCSYVGSFNPANCRTGCGEPSQRYYHIPRAWLNSVGNVITVFEEQANVDPSKITIVQMN